VLVISANSSVTALGEYELLAILLTLLADEFCHVVTEDPRLRAKLMATGRSWPQRMGRLRANALRLLLQDSTDERWSQEVTEYLRMLDLTGDEFDLFAHYLLILALDSHLGPTALVRLGGALADIRRAIGLPDAPYPPATDEA